MTGQDRMDESRLHDKSRQDERDKARIGLDRIGRQVGEIS